METAGKFPNSKLRTNHLRLFPTSGELWEVRRFCCKYLHAPSSPSFYLACLPGLSSLIVDFLCFSKNFIKTAFKTQYDLHFKAILLLLMIGNCPRCNGLGDVCLSGELTTPHSSFHSQTETEWLPNQIINQLSHFLMPFYAVPWGI